jgi:hypothetical protein
VLPRVRGGDGLLGVESNRRGDVDGVDSGIGDEIAPVRIGAAGADLARELFNQIGARAADGGERAAAAFAQRFGDALADYVAGADQSPAHRQGLGNRDWGLVPLRE